MERALSILAGFCLIFFAGFIFVNFCSIAFRKNKLFFSIFGLIFAILCLLIAVTQIILRIILDKNFIASVFEVICWIIVVILQSFVVKIALKTHKKRNP